MKKLAVIGSSGSIGRQTLEVVRRYPEKFSVASLAVRESVGTLERQIREFRPTFAAVADESIAAGFPREICGCRVAFGAEAVAQAASVPEADMTVMAVVGMSGLRPVLAAIEAGKDIALANKESLVAAGAAVTSAAQKKCVKIIPVDSEHSAVWQCLRFGGDVRRIILTASGGPFRGMTRDRLREVSPEQAVRHPNWNMGKKISVDSATMMNKGLEIIEARWLFGTDKIDYVIHPESIIHSMVEFVDGAVAAQMSTPSMDITIQLALSYPDRLPSGTAPLAFDKNLTFMPPDEKNFPLPAVCREAMRKGGNIPCAVNAANEAAVKLFLSHKIRFTDIYDIVEKYLTYTGFTADPDTADIYATFDDVYSGVMREN